MELMKKYRKSVPSFLLQPEKSRQNGGKQRLSARQIGQKARLAAVRYFPEIRAAPDDLDGFGPSWHNHLERTAVEAAPFGPTGDAYHEVKEHDLPLVRQGR